MRHLNRVDNSLIDPPNPLNLTYGSCFELLDGGEGWG